MATPSLSSPPSRNETVFNSKSQKGPAPQEQVEDLRGQISDFLKSPKLVACRPLLIRRSYAALMDYAIHHYYHDSATLTVCVVYRWKMDWVGQ